MFRTFAFVFVILSVALTFRAEEPAAVKRLLLEEAVDKFNQKSQETKIGKDQPPLTVDEVIAAIRAWDRKKIPASDKVYEAYQKIAESRVLPDKAEFDFMTGFTNDRFEFDVWWVNLSISTGPKSGYGFRIREQILSSRPLTIENDVLNVPKRVNPAE